MAWVRTMSAAGILLYIAVIVFLIFVKMKINLVMSLVNFMFGWSARLNRFLQNTLESFAIGLQSLGSATLLIKVGFHSLLVWLSSAGYYYVTMLAFHNAQGGSWGAEIGFIGAMFLLSSIALGVMVPAGPGFVGTFQFACIIALTALGMDKTTAEGFSIIAHAAQYIPVTTAGNRLPLPLQHEIQRDKKPPTSPFRPPETSTSQAGLGSLPGLRFPSDADAP